MRPGLLHYLVVGAIIRKGPSIFIDCSKSFTLLTCKEKQDTIIIGPSLRQRIPELHNELCLGLNLQSCQESPPGKDVDTEHPRCQHRRNVNIKDHYYYKSNRHLALIRLEHFLKAGVKSIHSSKNSNPGDCPLLPPSIHKVPGGVFVPSVKA